MEVVLLHHLLEELAVEGRGHEDESAALDDFLREGHVDGLDGVVGGGASDKAGDGHNVGVGSELLEQAVNPLEVGVRGLGGVTLPDELLDLLVDFGGDSVDDVLLEGQFLGVGADADEVLGIFAKQGVRADVHVHLDDGGGDGALGEGGSAGSSEAAALAVLKCGGELQIVQVRGGLDTSLDADALAGGRAYERKVFDDEVLVVLHVGGQGGYHKIS